jgi:hypothetical protein
MNRSNERGEFSPRSGIIKKVKENIPFIVGTALVSFGLTQFRKRLAKNVEPDQNPFLTVFEATQDLEQQITTSVTSKSLRARRLATVRNMQNEIRDNEAKLREIGESSRNCGLLYRGGMILLGASQDNELIIQTLQELGVTVEPGLLESIHSGQLNRVDGDRVRFGHGAINSGIPTAISGVNFSLVYARPLGVKPGISIHLEFNEKTVRTVDKTEALQAV